MIELVFALALQGAPGAVPDTLTQLKAGQANCVNPDTAKKTCQSLSTYALRPDGKWDTKAVVLIAPQPLITLAVTTPSEVKDQTLCGKVEQADMAAASLTMNGQPMEGNLADQIRQGVDQAMIPLYGRMMCSAFEPEGQGIVSRVSVDGERMPMMDQTIQWVSPADGWTVGQ